MEDSRLRRFGRIVSSRRERLGLTRDQVKEAGGPSDTTLAKVERGGSPPPTATTLQKLDTGLGWTKGSAARALAGGEPTLLDDDSTAGAKTDSRPMVMGPDAIPLAVSEVTNLLGIAKKLNAAIDGCTGSDALDETRKDFNQFVTRVAGAYATELLERNGGPASATLPPITEMAFAHILDLPVTAEDKSEREEQLYRRWLSQRPIKIDAEMEAAFVRRWRSAQSRV